MTLINAHIRDWFYVLSNETTENKDLYLPILVFSQQEEAEQYIAQNQAADVTPVDPGTEVEVPDEVKAIASTLPEAAPETNDEDPTEEA